MSEGKFNNTRKRPNKKEEKQNMNQYTSSIDIKYRCIFDAFSNFLLAEPKTLIELWYDCKSLHVSTIEMTGFVRKKK